MGWYERRVFTPILDSSLDVPKVHAERARALAPAAGDILEIGVGTGLNLPNYPASVARLTALGPEESLDARAARRAAARGLTVEYVAGDARAMPFEAGRFDTVAATLVLCTIPEPARAVAEVVRVLRPGGQFLFFEHVVRPPGFARACQRAANPLNQLLGCGCSLLRDTRALLAGAGFAALEVEERRSAALPFLSAWVVSGRAVR